MVIRHVVYHGYVILTVLRLFYVCVCVCKEASLNYYFFVPYFVS